MVIGIDASRANKTQKTGTEWYSYFLIQEFKKIDSSYEFILFSKEPLEGDLAHLPNNFKNRVLHWPLKLFWTQIRLSWEMMVRPPDILFVPAHTLPIFCRAKTVVTIHDVGFCAYPELYSWKDKLYHRFSVWYASRFAGKILTISEFSKKEVIKYFGADQNKIAVIPLAAAEKENISIPPLVSRTADSGESQQFLFYIGRLERKKNILGILQAFKILHDEFPKLRLVLAGLKDFGYEEFSDYIEKQNLSAFVDIKNYINEAEKAALYSNALAFIFPTLYEGFGLPILEAQSYGCPVITSQGGAHEEIAGRSAVLVDPNKPEEIAAAARKLIIDPELSSRFRNLGLENVKKYTWAKCAKDTLHSLII